MARVRPRRIFWDLPNAATHANVYAALADDQDFLAQADAGQLSPVARVASDQPQELRMGVDFLPDGTYQFAVVSEDAANGRFGDPYQHPDWTSIPLVLSALPPASGGGYELL